MSVPQIGDFEANSNQRHIARGLRVRGRCGGFGERRALADKDILFPPVKLPIAAPILEGELAEEFGQDFGAGVVRSLCRTFDNEHGWRDCTFWILVGMRERHQGKPYQVSGRRELPTLVVITKT
jgi:hypothetical protein